MYIHVCISWISTSMNLSFWIWYSYLHRARVGSCVVSIVPCEFFHLHQKCFHRWKLISAIASLFCRHPQMLNNGRYLTSAQYSRSPDDGPSKMFSYVIIKSHKNICLVFVHTCVRSLGTDLSLAALESTIGLIDQMQIRPQLSFPETSGKDALETNHWHLGFVKNLKWYWYLPAPPVENLVPSFHEKRDDFNLFPFLEIQITHKTYQGECRLTLGHDHHRLIPKKVSKAACWFRQQYSINDTTSGDGQGCSKEE